MPDRTVEARYNKLRECVKSKEGRIMAQALFWNNESRTEFDAAVDALVVPPHDPLPEAKP